MGSSRFIGALTALLFLAVCAYAGAYLYPGAVPGETALLRSASFIGSAELEGVAVRWEETLSLPRGAELYARSGERLPCGAALARSADGELITAGASSVFFSSCDGYESFSPETLSPLTVSSVEALLAQKPARSAGARLVLSHEWYFAALSSDESLPSDGFCQLLFSELSEPVSAQIVSLSAREDGRQAILLRLTAGGDALLSLRHCRARLITGEYSGLKAPERAVSYSAGGLPFVNIVTAGSVERAAVDILYTGEGFCLLSPADSSGLLRDGSRVLLG